MKANTGSNSPMKFSSGMNLGGSTNGTQSANPKYVVGGGNVTNLMATQKMNDLFTGGG
jgi:hypothetical protein